MALCERDRMLGDVAPLLVFTEKESDTLELVQHDIPPVH